VNVTVAIPWRGGQKWREARFIRVGTHMRELLPDAKHQFADSGHQPFSRAGSRNLAVALATHSDADVVVICDADTLVEAEPLHEAIAAAHDGVLHLPYIRYRSLTPDGTNAHLVGTPALECDADHDHNWATGGVIVITPDAWAVAGGMDERFVGWGFEDVAFRQAADTLLGPTVKHPGTITHLWHPVETALGTPQHIANAALCERYNAAAGQPEAMRALIAERQPARV
jgi:hypothetical protein